MPSKPYSNGEDLPENIFDLCEKPTVAWPEGWARNFAAKNFFHLVGMRQYLHRKGLRDSIAVKASFQDPYVESVSTANPPYYQLINDDWIAQIFHEPGLDKNSMSIIDLKDKMLSMGSCDIQYIIRVINGQPIGFGRALSLLLALRLFMDDNGDKNTPLKDVVQIRFAGYYLPNFKPVYDDMSKVERAALTTKSWQKIPDALDGIARRVPITFPLAKRIDRLTASPNRETPLDVEVYQSINEISVLALPKILESPAKGESNKSPPKRVRTAYQNEYTFLKFPET